MPKYQSISPDSQVERMFKDLKKSAKSNNTKSSGSKYISEGNSIVSENDDGTLTVIGGNGLQEFVGDTTIPPVPAGITAQPNNGSVIVAWDGTLADPLETVPIDWSHLEIRANGIRQGEIMGNRSGAMSFPAEVGTTVSVVAVAFDKADNVSDPSTPISVEVTSVTGSLPEGLEQQLADNTQAIADAQAALTEAEARLEASISTVDGKATTAVSTAGTAASEASTANTNASTALSTATTAGENATRAQNLAQSALSGNLVPAFNIVKGVVWGTSANIHAAGTGYAGTGSYYFADSPNAASFFATHPDGKIDVIPGNKYLLSAWIRSNTAFGASAQSRLVVRQYTATGTFTQATVAGAAQGPADTWQKLEGTYTVPVNIVSITVGYEVFASHIGDLRFSYPSAKQFLDISTVPEAGLPATKIALNDTTNSYLGNFLQVNVGNLTATGTTNLNSVVAQRIAAGTAEFQTVRVENLTAGTGIMNSAAIGKITTAQLEAGIQTASGQYTGLKFTSASFTAWNGQPTPTFELQSSTGNVFMRGATLTSSVITGSTIQTSANANEGLKFTDSGMNLYAPGTTIPVFSLNANGTADIDGAFLRTGTVSADKISLIGGLSGNILHGGNGSADGTWTGNYYYLDEGALNPQGSVRSFVVTGTLNSPKMRTSFGDKYTFSFMHNASFSSGTSGTVGFKVIFHKKNGTVVNAVDDGRTTQSSWQTTTFPTKVENNDVDYEYVSVQITKTGTNSNHVKVTNIALFTEAQTTLTSTGMTSTVNGVETIRLNGQDNLLIGRFRTAPEGNPQILIQPTAGSYNGNQLAMWFTPDGSSPGFGSTTGYVAGIWMENIPTLGTTYPLSLRGQAGGGVNVHGPLKILPDSSSFPALITTNGQNLQISPAGGDLLLASNKTTVRSSETMVLESTANAVDIKGLNNVTFFTDSFLQLRNANGTGYNRTTSATSNVHIDSGGKIIKTGSSRRFKTDIETYEPNREWLDVRTTRWHDKAAIARAAHIDRNAPMTDEEKHLVEEAERWYVGTIAEENAQSTPHQIGYDDEGQIDSYSYDRDGVMLKPFVRELFKRVEALENERKSN